MFENKKNIKVVLAWCLYYFLISVFGAAINTCANLYDRQQFGHFLSSLISPFYGTMFTMVIVLFFVLLKRHKGQQSFIKDNVLTLIIGIILLWITSNALYNFINWICDAVAYDGEFLSDYSKGRVAIECLELAGAIALFVMTKYYQVIGNFFKSLKGNKKDTHSDENNGENDDTVKQDNTFESEQPINEGTPDEIQ